MPRFSLRSRVLAAAVAALGLAGWSGSAARAAVITYNFDVNGSSQTPSNFGIITGTTYDWDSTTNGGFWSNNSTSATGNIATIGWSQGNFPKFQPSGTPTYIVTVSNTEQVAGMFFSTAQNLTINAIGTGNLNIVTGLQGVLGSASADVTINAPITGPGEIQPNSGGNMRLNGINTYSGGTNLFSTATLIHFNNSSSFGSNFINMGVAGFVPLLASGATTVTLPNNFTSSVSGGGVNFAADANTPTVSTGTWTLGANNLVLRNNAGPTSPVTLSNVISGTATVALSTNTAGSTIKFSGANTYTGATSITGPGGTGTGTSTVRLILGAPGTIATSTSVILAGGILDPGGLTQSMPATTLALTASTAASTIDYSVGAAELDFANSSAVAWTGTLLNLTNWNPSVNFLRFGTTNAGLTAAQLAKIEFNGAGLGTAMLDANGYVVPEPASLSLLGLAATTLLARKRRA